MLSSSRSIQKFLFVLMLAGTAISRASTLEPAWSEVFQNVHTKVVQVFSFISYFDWKEPFKKPPLRQSRGTGFLVSPEGDIYTNFHVVNNAMALFIQLPATGRERFEVEFLGGSPKDDCAHIRLKPEALARLKSLLNVSTLAYLPLGDSNLVTPGTEVMLLGYPLGLENVKSTAGIISGQQSIPSIGECLSITAASMHGNSGGPCINRKGEVIGIIAACMYDHSDGMKAENLNFMLPITRLKSVLDTLNNGLVVERPFWGFDYSSTTIETLRYSQVPLDIGARITEVLPGSLAHQAGLTVGDILIEINGFTVDRFATVQVPWTSYKLELADILERIPYGSPITFTVYHHGEKYTRSTTVNSESPLNIKRFYFPYQKSPAYTVFGGMVIMELTQNHFDAFIGDFMRKLSSGESVTKFLDFFKFLNSKKGYKSRLIITNQYPETETAKSRIFENTDILINKVNGIRVNTIPEFEKAVLAGLTTKQVIIESAQGTLVVLSLEDIVKQEPLIAKQHDYPISSLIQTIASELQISIPEVATPTN